jgi:hypothetical protein
MTIFENRGGISVTGSRPSLVAPTEVKEKSAISPFRSSYMLNSSLKMLTIVVELRCSGGGWSHS